MFTLPKNFAAPGGPHQSPLPPLATPLLGSKISKIYFLIFEP